MDIGFNSQEYIDCIKSSIIKPKFRLSLLYPNETVKEEIIDEIIDKSGTLNINYQQGQRRSLNFALENSSGQWTPDPINGKIWINSKFKLYLEVEDGNGDIYSKPNGVFVVADPNANHGGAQKIVNVQCYDKFALLDGTLGGNIEGTYTITANTNIKQAVQDILMLDNGNGYPIDSVPIIFDNNYVNTTTHYTITKSPDSTLGEILIELANMIACNVYYNENGNLVFSSGVTDIAYLRQPTLWDYNEQETEYLGSTLAYDFSKVKNRVTVVGANVNSGVIYSALSENINPQSPTRISKIGIKNLYIEDSNIYTQELAQDRADYELNRNTILNLTMDVDSTYMIHLDVDKCITITDDFYGFKNQRFVIQSLSIPISIDSQISISCTNVNTLPYYPSSS